MFNNLSKIPKELLIPAVGIILSVYVLVVRAAWVDTVGPTTVISADDWNQMAVVLAGLDAQAAQMEVFLPGQLCGRYVSTSGTVGLCQGYNPGNATNPCPSNFTRVGGVLGKEGRNVWTCVKN